MGNPLSPLASDRFMAELERKSMDINNLLIVRFRYVDDALRYWISGTNNFMLTKAIDFVESVKSVHLQWFSLSCQN